MIKKILLSSLFVFILGVVGGAIAFRNIGGNDPLYKPTGLNDTFPNVKNFDEYIQKSQKMIREARIKMGTVNSDQKRENQIIELRAPFEIKPEHLAQDQKGKTAKYRNGVLIAHGLNRTPREMRSVAEFFSKLGFLVRVTLLPGHGTVVGDLGRVQAEEWLKMHTFGIESFKGEVDNLYLMGFSTGGLLTCIQALDHKKMKDNNVRGLILISPALEIKLKSAVVLPYLFTTMDKFPMLSFPVRNKEVDDYGYQSVSLNAGYQIYRLIQKLKEGRKTSEIQLPIFTATTMEDLIVDVPAVKDYLYGLLNDDNQHVIYTAESIKLPKVTGRVEQINSSQEAWGGRVIGFSHSAMHVAPEDHHYGRFTKFHPCGHYEEGSELHKECLDGNKYLNDEHRTCGTYFSDPIKLKACNSTKAFVGEASANNIKKYKPLQGLMYNNKFKYMFRVIDRFLFKTGGLDVRRYQLREYKRFEQNKFVDDIILEKLRNKYNNSDLSSALEDVSVDFDLGSVDFLALDKTNFSDLTAMSQFLELTNLFIKNNGDWEKGNALEDLSAIGKLDNIALLHIENSPVKNIAPLKNLKKAHLINLLQTNYVTKEQADDLRKALPNTKIVHFNQLGISNKPNKELMMDFKGDVPAYFANYHKNNPALVDAITTLFIQDLDLKSANGLEILKSLEDIRFNNTPVPNVTFFEPLKSKDLRAIKFINMNPSDAEKFQALVKVLERDFPKLEITVSFNAIIRDRLLKNGGDLADALKDIKEGFSLKKYMRNLDLSGSNISDLSSLADLRNLSILDLTATSVSNLKPISKLTNLSSLDVSKTQVASLVGVEGLEKLESIFLGETKVSDLSPLQTCKHLTLINADATNVDSLGVINQLPLLDTLRVNNTKIKNLNGLEGAKKLRNLSVAGTNVSDLMPLKDLTLSHANFDETQVADIAPLIDGKNRGFTFVKTPFGDAAQSMGDVGG